MCRLGFGLFNSSRKKSGLCPRRGLINVIISRETVALYFSLPSLNVYVCMFVGPNGSWFEFRYETRTGELLLKYGDQSSTKINDYKIFFLNIKNAEDCLISSYAFFCSEEISLRNIGLMRVIAKLWENKKNQEFRKMTDIPKTIKEEIDDVLQIMMDKVKVTNQEDADELFLSSKTNSDIIDI